ncbi:hypothetical protein [Streptomyces sp. YIM 98790]|uniref:hypothetical protein n=1 Tax=Streptomyces sp. YIM 98790 TaxID=2689077 RepID=UPI00140A2CC0|nr:hypothetical protein [Streptomyces sp. YIM 98790]
MSQPVNGVCGARRGGWEDGPAIGRHRLACVLPAEHAEAHRDALGKSWTGRCAECGGEAEVRAVLARGERGLAEREVCVACRNDPGAGMCVQCHGWTAVPVLVRQVDPGSGPVRGLYACPPCAAALVDAVQLWVALFDHTANCPACRTEETGCATARQLRAAHRTARRRTDPEVSPGPGG